LRTNAVGRYEVFRRVRPKLTCQRCDCFVQVPAPSRAIDGGLHSPVARVNL
jgi:transposase